MDILLIRGFHQVLCRRKILYDILHWIHLNIFISILQASQRQGTGKQNPKSYKRVVSRCVSMTFSVIRAHVNFQKSSIITLKLHPLVGCGGSDTAKWLLLRPSFCCNLQRYFFVDLYMLKNLH